MKKFSGPVLGQANELPERQLVDNTVECRPPGGARWKDKGTQPGPVDLESHLGMGGWTAARRRNDQAGQMIRSGVPRAETAAPQSHHGR